MTNLIEYIENNTIRYEASYRGGGIEIGLDNLLKTEGYKMTAYQNYLGGGLLGRICHSYNFDLNKLNKSKQNTVNKITEVLQEYYHNLTNHEGNEWEEQSYTQNQCMPESAY
jgi:hypothetical protein